MILTFALSRSSISDARDVSGTAVEPASAKNDCSAERLDNLLLKDFMVGCLGADKFRLPAPLIQAELG